MKQSVPGGAKSVSFLGFNRNKRSSTLDLKNPRGIEVIKRLIPNVDVVIENFASGVMERLGIGYETLAAINPRVILLREPADSGAPGRMPNVPARMY